MSSALGAVRAVGEAVGGSSLVIEASQSLHVSLALSVNWNGDGVTFVDESAYCHSYQSDRGRARVNDAVATGTCTIQLDNTTGRFSPWNSSSALYPNVVPGRAVQITATYRGETFAQFGGQISEFTQNTHAAAASLTVIILDVFEHFRLTSAKADLDAGVTDDPTVDAVLTAILAAAGWTGTTRLDPGRSLDQYAQPTTNVLAALQHAALQEMGGLLFMGKDGALVFQNAAYRASQPVAMALSSVESMQLGARQSDVVDRVKTVYDTYRWPLAGTAASSIYSGQAGAEIPAQSSATITDFFTSVAATSVVSPEMTTDYAANSAVDGSGIDVTESVWLSSFTSSGTAFTAVLYNALPYPVYLTSFQVRGTALTQAATPAFVEQSSTAAIIPNQEETATFDFVTDHAAIFAWTGHRLSAMSRLRPRPVIQIVGRTPELMRLILGLDLSDRLAFTDTGAAWLSGLTRQFYVEHISLSIVPRQIVSATLQLFDYDQGVA